MSSETDKTVEHCLRTIINEVAAQTGQAPEDVRRLFDLAGYVFDLEKAKAAGTLAPAPRSMQ